MPQQINAALDRAFSLATSDRAGRSTSHCRVKCSPRPFGPTPTSATDRRRCARPWPTLPALAEAAEILASAERPLIITASLGHNHAAVRGIAQLAARFALPVVSHVPKSLCLPTDHPMHLGVFARPFRQERRRHPGARMRCAVDPDEGGSSAQCPGDPHGPRPPVRALRHSQFSRDLAIPRRSRAGTGGTRCDDRNQNCLRRSQRHPAAPPTSRQASR